MPTTTPKTLRRKATVSAVAARAGVSPATVSLVLNRRGKELRINQQTQQRVREAARQLNYVPNYLARGLSGASTKSIGLVWSLGGSASNAPIAYQLIQRIAKRGYVCHMTEHLSSADFTSRALTDQLQRRVDGLILHAGGDILDDPRVLGLLGEVQSAVIVSAREADLQCDLPHDVIHHDRATAMRQVVDHLVSSGRQRLGMFSIATSNAIKLGAIASRLRELNAAPAQQVLPLCDPVSDNYLATSRQQLDQHYAGRPFDFDAVICTNDDMAVAMIDFLRTRGLRVPDDVAVVGFDDSSIAPMLNPPLASVTRYDADVATVAEEAMFERLADPSRKPRRCTIEMTFNWRASAGAPEPNSA